MKRVFLPALCLIIAVCAWGTVWHVNQDSAAYSDFAQVTTAVASASVANGDTLYVYGHVNVYDTAHINKSITIIGPGYFLGSNPGLQHSALSARIANMYLDVVDIVVMGMDVDGYIYVNAQNAAVIGCTMPSMRLNSSNALFKGCYFKYKSGYNSNGVQLSSALNSTFVNCFFGGNNGFNSLYIPANSTATVSYCVFRGTVTINNTDFYNNILYKDPGYGLGFDANANVHHNVFVAYGTFDWATVVTGTDNLLNYDGPLFVTGGSTDGMYELVDDPLNLALTAGVFDDECGMFGGTTPYKLSGIPPIPSIYEFNIPSVGNTLPLQVKARSND